MQKIDLFKYRASRYFARRPPVLSNQVRLRSVALTSFSAAVGQQPPSHSDYLLLSRGIPVSSNLTGLLPSSHKQKTRHKAGFSICL